MADGKPKRATRRGFRRQVETELLRRGPDLIAKFFDSIEAGLSKGDKGTRELTARMLGLDKGSGGISITNQLMQANAAAPVAPGGRFRSMDGMIAQIEAREREQKLLNAPASEVIDVDAD